jgi:hypothetical protein
MKFETFLANGIPLWDARGELLSARPYRKRRKAVDRIIVHHSGKLGRKGFDGMQGSARFVVKHRGWPGFAYHYWVPYHHHHETGGYVVFRGNADDRHTNHTFGWNARGVSVCLQGNLGKTGPSPHQQECLEALLPWIAAKHRLDLPHALTWHSECTRKKACPGKATAAYLERVRAR